MITARPYQTEAIQAVLAKWSEGVTRPLISLPTGCGKTIIFGLLAGELKQRTLVIAHREELLTQAKDKISLVYPGADVGIYKGQEREGLNCNICVASVQTAVRHIDLLQERGFTLCVCDEAHRAPAKSYMKVFEGLGFMEDDPAKLLLGVTATAYRGDNVGLRNVFQAIVFERSILAMIKAGYLCDIRGLEIQTEADISGVHTYMGDFQSNELSMALNTPERNELIAKSYLEHGEGRQGVAFCVDVRHSLDLAEAFRAKGVRAAAIYGAMQSDIRRRTLADYEAGKLDILTNCNVLTEGWDCPNASLVIMARPTKSKGLFVQCVGRGLRLAPNKEDCLLIDFVDTAQRHKLCNFGTLAGDDLQVKAKKKKRLLDLIDEQEQAEQKRKGRLTGIAEKLDLFGGARFVWIPSGENYRVNTQGGALICKRTAGGYIPLFVGKQGEALRPSEDILPLSYAMGVSEDYARKMIADTGSLDKNAHWRSSRPTENQIAYLDRLGVRYDADITKGQASTLIEQALSEPASSRQLYYIRAKDLHPHPELLTKREASILISQDKAF